MVATAAWIRRLKKLDEVMPQAPVGSRHWLELFGSADFHYRLTEREPDFVGLLAAYKRLAPPYADEAERLFRHLSELFGRAVDGVPPCSAAEFAELAAWFEANGDALPTIGWQKALDVGGGPEVTLASLRWQVGRGVGADGSGKAAETIRRLRAKHDAESSLSSPPADIKPRSSNKWATCVPNAGCGNSKATTFAWPASLG